MMLLHALCDAISRRSRLLIVTPNASTIGNSAEEIYFSLLKARREGKKALLLFPRELPWKLRFRLAFVYFANGKKQDAIREFENVLVIDPYNVWAYGYLALIYGEMGDIDKGIELTKKGLSIDKNVAALHLLLSEGYYKKGDNWGGWAERFEALRLKAIGY